MAVVFNAIIGILMVLPESSNIENLLDYFSFAMWTIYALTFISIIVFRYRKPYCDVERKFKVKKFMFTIFFISFYLQMTFRH